MRNKLSYFNLNSAINRQYGFTLIEIMVALMVISIALGAVINTTAGSLDMGSHIRNKTLALWVAQNYVNELVIEQQWLDVGKQTDTIAMDQHNWYLVADITPTANTNMRKVKISVFENNRDSNVLLSLNAYINRQSANRAIQLK